MNQNDFFEADPSDTQSYSSFYAVFDHYGKIVTPVFELSTIAILHCCQRFKLNNWTECQKRGYRLFDVDANGNRLVPPSESYVIKEKQSFVTILRNFAQKTASLIIRGFNNEQMAKTAPFDDPLIDQTKDYSNNRTTFCKVPGYLTLTEKDLDLFLIHDRSTAIAIDVTDLSKPRYFHYEMPQTPYERDDRLFGHYLPCKFSLAVPWFRSDRLKADTESMISLTRSWRCRTEADFCVFHPTERKLFLIIEQWLFHLEFDHQSNCFRFIKDKDYELHSFNLSIIYSFYDCLNDCALMVTADNWVVINDYSPLPRSPRITKRFKLPQSSCVDPSFDTIINQGGAINQLPYLIHNSKTHTTCILNPATAIQNDEFQPLPLVKTLDGCHNIQFDSIGKKLHYFNFNDQHVIHQ